MEIILSVKAYGIIIDANRFKNKYRLWGYCGLVRTKRESGKISYSRKDIRYSRKLKCIFKMATQAALGGKNDIREYYEYLLQTKKYTRKRCQEYNYPVYSYICLCCNEKQKEV